MDVKEFGRRWRLDGRRAVVTGATKGIGRAVAEELCGLGAEVLIAARDPEGVGRAVEEMRAAGHRAHGVAADVGTGEGRRIVLAGAESLLGGADILVNNAGTNIRKRALDYTEDEYEFLLRTNMTSAFELCRMFHPSMKAGGAGSVVNVVSVAGMVSVGTGVIYAMTKAALIQMTRSLAAEPEEVSGVVAFLCLPIASYVTGQCVAPDGGFLAHGL